MPKRSWSFLTLIFLSVHLYAQAPFTKGVNLTQWFQVSSAREIQFTRFTKNDFEQIKSLGVDVIRLPINLHAMTNGEPDFTLDPLFLNFLDQAVDWSEELQIHLILDNHTFDPALNTPTNIGSTLVKVWTQMAAHYKDRSDYIHYEVLNEPHGITDATWGAIQQTVIDAIRTEDTKHNIVVGPANWNSYDNLKHLPVYTDPKLIYTFHFYDPFIFTHQGASWTDPSLVPLAGVPFPYNAGPMPALPASLKGTWLESAMLNYSADGTVNKVKSLIDIAVTFKNQRNVPVFCGEFGVYKPNSDDAHRVSWYKTVRTYFEEKNIPWTIWDYQEAFGLFEKGTNELFDYDLNVPLLNALELTVPPQQVYTKKPARQGLMIYDDYIGRGIVNASNRGTGMLDFYAAVAPKEGNYHLSWTESQQYSTIGFDFKPDTDLSLLKSNDHELRFWVRGNTASAKFDVRFVDTKTGTNDHPWRMGKTIEQVITTDQAWHEVIIRFADMEEKGSWDDAWFNPENKFDWTAIDRFEIVAEHHALTGMTLEFDQIQLFGDDIPNEEPEEPEEPITSVQEEYDLKDLIVCPNPVLEHAAIHFSLTKPSQVYVSIYASTGELIDKIDMRSLHAGNHTVVLKKPEDGGHQYATGVYFVRVGTAKKTMTAKVIFR
jgi:endoglucanase